MKKRAFMMAPIVVTLLAFFVWHTPLRGPLTQNEIDVFMHNQTESGGSSWAVSETFEAFLRSDDGRPFVMINLMEIRDVAVYPDGSETDRYSGAQADAAYGQSVLPLLLARGSYPIANATRSFTILNSLGSEAGAFDVAAIVRYRSRRDLLSMISSEAFLEAEVHKWASLENSLLRLRVTARRLA
ncbi:MAG: hypothetical protein AAF393_13185 [Pseudomonadota bacterium]